ncbi:MAG: adenylyltransferase/cytidyltransferase family protein [Verrucomicrobia bacterium]|nr:adenylyltransferase/cytidyltransferase family protein [Verrucomicrobiota bacterium]
MIKKILLTLVSTLTLTLTTQAEDAVHKPRRVYVDAVADMMHAGHVAMFKNARECGDYLIVGIHSDADVASYKRWPILTMQERIAVVEACRYVDEVIPSAPLRMNEEYIKKHQIDLVVHGDDFNPDTLMYWYGVPIRLGIFKTIPYTQGISTTDIIERIKERYCLESPNQE